MAFTSPKRASTAVAAVLILFSLSGCEDPEQARRAAQRAGVVSELQQIDSERALTGQRLAALERRWQQTTEEFESVRSQVADLDRRTNSYMMSHKMAVAALAAGFAGGLAALDDSGRLTEDARAIGAVVGIVALVWASGNVEEVTEVADQLLKANASMKALIARQAELQQARGEIVAQAESVRSEADRLGQAAGGLRVRLSAL